jgi:FkbM family methyltransferase
MIFWERIFNILDIYHFNRIINFLKPLEIEKVIDVGAHKGEFLSYILKLKKIKKIFVFEPQIAINKILSKKFKLIKKIKIFNYALDNKISKKYIYINKFTNTSTLSKFNKDSYYLKFKNLLTRSKNNYIDKYIVKTNTINNLFRNTELKKSLLKIDVEGLEINVLKGAKNYK